MQRVHVPTGAPFRAVADSLADRGIVRSATLFRLYARFTGADNVQAGTYEFREGERWSTILDDLNAGRIAADRLVVPEGWDIARIGPVLARIVDQEPDSIIAYMLDTASAARFQVPGPNLEGYIYPATYVIPAGAPLDSIIAHMVRRYRTVWTPERRALAEAAGFSEREVVTLASIVEKEARVRDEMPLMAAVFRNRLEIGYPLQADPTVQYALGEHQNRSSTPTSTRSPTTRTTPTPSAGFRPDPSARPASAPSTPSSIRPTSTTSTSSPDPMARTSSTAISRTTTGPASRSDGRSRRDSASGNARPGEPPPHAPDLMDLRLIVITDARIAAPRPVDDVVQAALEAGAPAIQLRDKAATAAELFQHALHLVTLTRPYGALLFVNDRLDVALAAGADGVHLGPHDLPSPPLGRPRGRAAAPTSSWAPPPTTPPAPPRPPGTAPTTSDAAPSSEPPPRMTWATSASAPTARTGRSGRRHPGGRYRRHPPRQRQPGRTDRRRRRRGHRRRHGRRRRRGRRAGAPGCFLIDFDFDFDLELLLP
jgi:UPF0755 protein